MRKRRESDTDPAIGDTPAVRGKADRNRTDEFARPRTSKRYGLRGIDGVPIWYEEHGDAAGPPLIALHGGILTFRRSFGDVLSWLRGPPGHRRRAPRPRPHARHRPAMSIERFSDDVAELIDRIAGGGPVDVWGYSLGALTATSLALRHPAKISRLVLAASNIRPDGYHPEITAPEQDDPRLPNEEEFAPGRPTTRR